MEYNIGIEMRDEYRSMEVASGAMKLVRDIMLTKSGETVVVNIDTATDMRVAEAIINAAMINPRIILSDIRCSSPKGFSRPL